MRRRHCLLLYSPGDDVTRHPLFRCTMVLSGWSVKLLKHCLNIVWEERNIVADNEICTLWIRGTKLMYLFCKQLVPQTLKCSRCNDITLFWFNCICLWSTLPLTQFVFRQMIERLLMISCKGVEGGGRRQTVGTILLLGCKDRQDETRKFQSGSLY
jgi:hypothetical protein